MIAGPRVVVDAAVAERGLGPLLLRRRLGRPDGRRLHEYQVTDTEFAGLKQYARRHWIQNYVFFPADCGALVLLLAEWSYRSATRLHGFWADASDDLGLPLREESELYERLGRALRYWKRPVREGRRRWISTLMIEGGFPVHLATVGFDAVLELLLKRFPWPTLAAEHDQADLIGRIARVLQDDGRRHVRLLTSPDAAAYLAEVVVHLGTYRALLVRLDLLPRSGRSLEQWRADLPVELLPERHLPLRSGLDGLFADLLFPTLDAGAGIARHPVEVALRWRADDPAPVAVVSVAGDGLRRAWLEELDPRLVAAQRVALAPAGAPRLAVACDAVGDSLRPTAPQTWPLHDVAGRDLLLVKRSLSGAVEVPIGVTIPAPAYLIADRSGRISSGEQVTAGVGARVWFARPTSIVRGDARPLGDNVFELGSADGAVIFQSELGEIELTMLPEAIDFQLLGRRWESGGRQGPFLGMPSIRSSSNQTLRVLVAGKEVGVVKRGSGQPLALPDVAASYVAEIQGAGVSTRARFAVLPTETSYRMTSPTRTGARDLMLVVPGLVGARVLDDDGRELAATVEVHDDGVATLELPPSEETRRCTCELRFAHDRIVKAPLFDVRRRIELDLGQRVVALRQTGAESLRLELALARYGLLRLSGFESGEAIEVRVRSSNRGLRHDVTRHLAPVRCDDDGQATLSLDDIVADLEPCHAHQLRFTVERQQWCIDLDDTVFAHEPESGAPYGALLPESRLHTSALTWRWLPAARQWEDVRELDMVRTADGWSPPIVALPEGGILAAPFDGERRAGYVRFLPGAPVPETEPDELVRALAEPHGLSLAVLRREFARGKEARSRLAEALTSLAELDAPGSLRLAHIAETDGALLAYIALTSDGLIEPRMLRGVPAGAWLRACEAVLDDRGEWLPALRCRLPEDLLLIALLASAGLPVGPANQGDVATAGVIAGILPDLRRVGTEPGEIDVCSPTSLLDYGARLGGILDDWRLGYRRELREREVDRGLRQHCRPLSAVAAYLDRKLSGVTHLVEAPVALATAAARVVLDLSLGAEQRGALRAELLNRRHARAWELFEPLVGALYLFSLAALWSDFRKQYPEPERARRFLALAEVTEMERRS